MNLFKKFAETITAEFLEKPDTYMKFTKVLSGPHWYCNARKLKKKRNTCGI